MKKEKLMVPEINFKSYKNDENTTKIDKKIP